MSALSSGLITGSKRTAGGFTSSGTHNGRWHLRSRLAAFVNHPTIKNREIDSRVFDPLGRNREEIVGDHGDIGQYAWRNLADVVLAENRPGVVRGVAAQRFLDRNLLLGNPTVRIF